jgi:hypothetical protein
MGGPFADSVAPTPPGASPARHARRRPTVSRRRQLLALWAVWIASRLFIVAQVGIWNSVDGPSYQDVNFYEATSNHLADTRTMPVEDSWQYPPLAAFLFLVPRLSPDYFLGFVVLMLLFDAAAVAMLSSRSNGLTLAGAWYWVLLLTTLSSFPVLRFDLVTAVTAVAALLLAQRRPFLSGLALGAGVMLKLWPVVTVLSEWNRRRLVTMLGGFLVVAASSLLAAAAFFGDQSGFLSNQAGRGLQVESVGATPWQLHQLITGKVVVLAQRNGTNEIDSIVANHVAAGLQVATLAAVVLVAGWAVTRDRLVRRHGRTDLRDIAVGRDAAFAATLLAMITNGVLSPQFLMWIVGVGAVCVGTRGSQMLRPALIVAAAVILTFGLYQSPAILVLRNTLLVVACADAAWTCFDALRRARPADRPRSPNSVTGHPVVD